MHLPSHQHRVTPLFASSVEFCSHYHASTITPTQGYTSFCLISGIMQSLPCIYHHTNTGLHLFLPHQWNYAVTTVHLPSHQHRVTPLFASSVELCSHYRASTITPTQGYTSFCLISGILQSLPCIYHHTNTGLHLFLPHQWNYAVTTVHLPSHQHRVTPLFASSVELCSHYRASTITPTQGYTSFCLISGIMQSLPCIYHHTNTGLHLFLPHQWNSAVTTMHLPSHQHRVTPLFASSVELCSHYRASTITPTQGYTSFCLISGIMQSLPCIYHHTNTGLHLFLPHQWNYAVTTVHLPSHQHRVTPLFASSVELCSHYRASTITPTQGYTSFCLISGILQSLPCIYHHTNTGLHLFLPHQWNSAVTTVHLPSHQHRVTPLFASSVEFCSHYRASTITPNCGPRPPLLGS